MCSSYFCIPIALESELEFLFATFCIFACGTDAAYAEQRLELNMQAALNQRQEFQLNENKFYIQDSRSHYVSVEGPAGEGPSHCLGSGFYNADGTNDIQGICIFGEGDDTFTMSWKAGEKSAANTWVIVGGTGKFTGMSGDGISTNRVERLFKAMPFMYTHVVGTIEIPLE